MPKYSGADASGLAKLNGYLTGFSYLAGHTFSAEDSAVFATCAGAPDATKHPHAFRWYIHVAALSGLGSFSAAPAAAAAPAKGGAKKAAKADDDDDDMDDLFDDDDDEEEAAAAPKGSRADQAKAAKAERDAFIQKKKEETLARLAIKEAKQRSLCNLEIKPWEAEQDLNDLFQRIKKTVNEETHPGIQWSQNCSLVDVAFGVKKMILTAVLPMTVSMDAIIEEITEDLFPDEIQSMSMTSMSLL